MLELLKMLRGLISLCGNRLPTVFYVLDVLHLNIFIHNSSYVYLKRVEYSVLHCYRDWHVTQLFNCT